MNGGEELDKAAIYCRLSKEDAEKSSDFSESIVNQRMLLLDYAAVHSFSIYDVYEDDDCSGLYNSSEDRPAFNRLISDARQGKFNIVLAKSQSRFTRNMEHMEKYLHNDFPLLGIRFIGVVDGVDTSIRENKKSRQISGLVNEWYCEDLSENIKSVFKNKMKHGQFLAPFACYGYKKDPEDHHKIIIDEEAAEVVKKIFSLSSQGFGVSAIAGMLTEMNIPTPLAYKNSKGLKLYNPNADTFSNKGYWSASTIKKILNNETYTGTLIQGTCEKMSYKSKRIIPVPKENWIVVRDNHEPVISKEDFDKTQDLLKSRRKSCKTDGESYNKPHIFSGKIKCADCKSTMTKSSGKSTGGYEYFICQLAKKSKLKECSRHSVRYDDLEAAIYQKIESFVNDISELSFEIVSDFIDKIYVHEKDDNGNIEVEVLWKI